MTKLITDIVCIKSCKKEDLIPTFAKVNLANKIAGYKLKKKVVKPVMVTELQDKHYQILKIRKELRTIAISLKSLLGLILLNAVIHQVEVLILSRLTAIKKRYGRNYLIFDDKMLMLAIQQLLPNR